MAISLVTTPLAMILQILVFFMGIYAGYHLKKTYAYLFAGTFFIFAIFDYLGSISVSTDILSSLNLIAILFALAGMYLLIRDAQRT